MVSPTPTSLLQPDAAAELVLSFVNTRPNKLQPEQFDHLQALQQWLVQHQLIGSSDQITETDLEEAKHLRSALVVLLLSHLNDAEMEASELQQATESLQRLTRNHPLVTLISSGDVQLVPHNQGGRAALGRILAAITELVLSGRWNRMKACRNDTCQTAFYDRTRNGAGTFCSQNPCGAMMAMRAYRKRKQEMQQDPGS
ncbi:CGNR zinc finger domain-containing protein [Deinococcus cellulosilyticus]|nr:CGNR zinc finger domain-containing protein [Deinococcus cellulosilyticus]